MGLELDETFVQAVEHRPNPDAPEAGNIPLIDLSPLLAYPTLADVDASTLPQSLLDQVEAACRDWGFFLVANHGVPADTLERAVSAVRGFFELPGEEKQKVRRDEKHPLGYNDKEFTKNVRDWKEMYDFAANEPLLIPESTEPGDTALLQMHNQWPENPKEFREAIENYMKAAENLAYKLLGIIALTLKLPANRFNGYFEETTNILRLLCYPPCSSPDIALGCGRHKDSGGLTVLFQDEVGGLEVKRKSDGEWVRVKPIRNTLIINVGSIIQVWTNDKYESVEHRVAVNSEKKRFSIPFFLNPSRNTMVGPLEELVSEESPAKYVQYSWGMFFRSRNKSTFKKEVVNVQIDHFKKKE